MSQLFLQNLSFGQTFFRNPYFPAIFSTFDHFSLESTCCYVSCVVRPRLGLCWVDYLDDPCSKVWHVDYCASDAFVSLEPAWIHAIRKLDHVKIDGQLRSLGLGGIDAAFAPFSKRIMFNKGSKSPQLRSSNAIGVPTINQHPGDCTNKDNLLAKKSASRNCPSTVPQPRNVGSPCRERATSDGFQKKLPHLRNISALSYSSRAFITSEKG